MNEKGSRWHEINPISICQHLHTNAACGLSRKAARSRLKKEGRNPLFDDTQKRQKFIKELLLDPATLLMLFSALLAVVFLSPLQIACTVVPFLFLLQPLSYF